MKKLLCILALLISVPTSFAAMPSAVQHLLKGAATHAATKAPNKEPNKESNSTVATTKTSDSSAAAKEPLVVAQPEVPSDPPKPWHELLGYLNCMFEAMIRLVPQSKSFIKAYKKYSFNDLEAKKKQAFLLIQIFIDLLKGKNPERLNDGCDFFGQKPIWDKRAACMSEDIFETGLYVLGCCIAKIQERMTEEQQAKLEALEKQRVSEEKQDAQELLELEPMIAMANRIAAEKRAEKEYMKMKDKMAKNPRKDPSNSTRWGF